MAADDLALTPYVPKLWTLEMRDALDDWTFGSLTPIPPLMWAQYAGLDPVLQVEVDPDDAGLADAGLEDADQVEAPPAQEGLDGAGVGAVGEVRMVCGPDDPVRDLVVAEADWASDKNGEVVAGLAISQTCDVVATGPGARHATVQVAPVVRVDTLNPERRLSLERWDVADRALLEPPNWEGTYVADLRLSVPVSKGVLARHRPVPAFPDEKRMLLLAEHVATKVRRPALHDFLSETVRDEIRQSIKSSKVDSLWWAPVEEVLVTATPDRLKPTHAQLLVVSQGPLDPAAKQRWHDLNERLANRGKKAGIVMRSPLHNTAVELTADVYRAAVKLHIPELRTPPY
jgi:hypothetical protein